MTKNQLNYLKNVRRVQREIAQLLEESAGFRTYKSMWRQLCEEEKFFGNYHTFMRYAHEARLNERIDALEKQETDRIRV